MTPVGLADASADGSGDALPGTLLEVAGVALADGVGSGPVRPSGARTTIPPSSSAATAIPTTSPATIDRRPITAGAYQYERLRAPFGDRCYHAGPMRLFADRIRTRFVPAILTALGVAFLAAGLLSYTQPVTAEPVAAPTPSPTAPADVVATPSPRITLPPLGSAPPPSPTLVPADRMVTRVRIAALDIDLPVITSAAVPCDVALEYIDPHLGAPGEGRATYLYAHAQAGMFLPLLTQSQVSNGSKMKGMVVEVFTNDDQRFLYVITKVLRHVSATTAFDAPVRGQDR